MYLLLSIYFYILYFFFISFYIFVEERVNWILKNKGKEWFERQFLQYLSPISVTALLLTLILLFAFKGELIVKNPLHIFLIAVPLFIQTNFIFLIA